MIVEHNIIRYTSGSDDRRPCAQCDHLRGMVCTVASPGCVVSAVRGYRPALPDLSRRCKSYISDITKNELS